MVIEPETPDEATEPRPAAHRRFARLVESPVGRRLVPRRLVVAVTMSVGFLLVASVVLVLIRNSIKGYVDGRPEFDLPFSEIKLEPEVPAYIRPGRGGFLEAVRLEARRPERLPMLSLNVEELLADFRRSPWVESVSRIERRYRGLTVHLTFRRPVAVVQSPRARGAKQVREEVIDRFGVILFGDDIERTESGIRGFDEPLIAILNPSEPIDPVAGQPWTSSLADKAAGKVDEKILGAVRLADFLRSCPGKTPGGVKAPRFLSISYYQVKKPGEKALRGYFLYDSDKQWIWWKSAPGGEAVDEPTAVEKWTMLLKQIDASGPIKIEPGKFLKFTPSGCSTVWPDPP